MGWMFGWDDRKSLVKHLIEPDPKWGKTVAHCFVGNDLWAVMEHAPGTWSGDDQRFIVLFMLRGGRNQEWGYKDVSEDMGPCQTSCPLKYLEMVPNPPNKYARDWRERVRAYHARMTRKVQKGEVWSLKGCRVDWVVIESVRPLCGRHKWGMYRISKRWLGERLLPFELGWSKLATEARVAAYRLGLKEDDEFLSLLNPAIEAEQDIARWAVLSDWLADRGADDLVRMLSAVPKTTPEGMLT
jgi:hypothetical protein